MFFENPIPNIVELKGWKEVKIYENDEKLVPLSKVRPSKLIVNPYFLQGCNIEIKELYAREMVLNLLLMATHKLPIGYRLVVIDAWRPTELQQYLFDLFKDHVGKEYTYYDWAEIDAYTEDCVSKPGENGKCPSPHLTGGAVDVRILNDSGEFLYMGNDYGEMEFETYTRFFEEKLERGKLLNENEELALKNRRLLYHVMSESGFINNPRKWWHFDFGNQHWGKAIKQNAFYGETEPKILLF